jgi:glycosyltransferase involved in cell wall biosynthesis
LACGTPFVATQVGGVAELSSDPANRLVPPGDAGLFAEAVSRSLTERRPLSTNLEFRSWSDCAENLLQILRPKVVLSNALPN